MGNYLKFYPGGQGAPSVYLPGPFLPPVGGGLFAQVRRSSGQRLVTSIIQSPRSIEKVITDILPARSIRKVPSRQAVRTSSWLWTLGTCTRRWRAISYRAESVWLVV